MYAMKAVFGALVAGAVGISLVGCGDSSKATVASVTAPITSPVTESKPPIAKPPVLKVALIMKTLTNPFFLEMEKGARRAEAEKGINLDVKAATQETSIEQQIQLVEDQIAARVAAIVIAPGDSQRLVPVLKKAQDAGIKIVNIDNRLSKDAMSAAGMKPVPFISVANDKAAYLAAKFVADKISKPTDAAIFEGIRSADNANQRKSGAEKAFKENSKLKIVAMESANWKIDEAYELAKRLFKKHPSIGIVFCANDMMALGVVKYLQETGKKQVLVAGFDGMDDAKASIRAGQMAASIDQQAANQGYQGVITALAILRGESVPEIVEVDAALITADSLK